MASIDYKSVHRYIAAFVTPVAGAIKGTIKSFREQGGGGPLYWPSSVAAAFDLCSLSDAGNGPGVRFL